MYHISLGICFTFIALLVLYGILILFLSARADNPPPIDLQLSGVVAEVNSGPTTVITSGGGGPPITPPTKQPTLNTPYVTIDYAYADTNGAAGQNAGISYEEVKLSDGTKVWARIYDIQLPQFSGLTNIPNALIYIQIQSANKNINSTSSVNANGAWAWNSLDQLSAGTYTFIVTAVDPNSNVIHASASEYFEVKIPAGSNTNPTQTTGKTGTGQTTTGTGQPTSGQAGTGQNNPSTYVFVNIPANTKEVPPGGEIFVTVKFVNLNSNGQAIKIPAEYIIEDSNNNIVMDTTEDVSVVDQISLLKSFYISGELPEGDYTLIVKAPVAGAIAEASDTFTVKGNKVVTVSENGRINLTAVFQCLTALFLFFALIAYFEYYKVSAISKEIKKISEDDLKELDKK
jgi:hypothetical protein